jgi:hypothetical protein
VRHFFTSLGIEVVAAESFPGSVGADMTIQLQNLASKDVTIILYSSYTGDARTMVQFFFFRLREI